MRTYSLISQKGGAGKSTLVRQLSVLAAEDGGPSIIIDLDPQKTSTSWWQRRQKIDPNPEYPDLLNFEGSTLTSAISRLKEADGTIFVDTRPAVEAQEEEAAKVADLVIVPVRPSPDDVEAVIATLRMVRRLGKRSVIVVNASRNEARAVAARAALSQYPIPVCPFHLTDRTAYLDASFDGLGVGEMKGAGAREASSEIRRVWDWIKTEGANHG